MLPTCPGHQCILDGTNLQTQHQQGILVRNIVYLYLHIIWNSSWIPGSDRVHLILKLTIPSFFGDILFSVNDTYVDSLNLEGLQNSESVWHTARSRVLMLETWPSRLRLSTPFFTYKYLLDLFSVYLFTVIDNCPSFENAISTNWQCLFYLQGNNQVLVTYKLFYVWLI